MGISRLDSFRATLKYPELTLWFFYGVAHSGLDEFVSVGGSVPELLGIGCSGVGYSGDGWVGMLLLHSYHSLWPGGIPHSSVFFSAY